MKLSKKISTLILSLVLLIGTFGHANAAKRLHAAIADWTGGIITCEAVSYTHLTLPTKRIV